LYYGVILCMQSSYLFLVIAVISMRYAYWVAGYMSQHNRGLVNWFVLASDRQMCWTVIWLDFFCASSPPNQLSGWAHVQYVYKGTKSVSQSLRSQSGTWTQIYAKRAGEWLTVPRPPSPTPDHTTFSTFTDLRWKLGKRKEIVRCHLL
jgi:hypothetical protein